MLWTRKSVLLRLQSSRPVFRGEPWVVWGPWYAGVVQRPSNDDTWSKDKRHIGLSVSFDVLEGQIERERRAVEKQPAPNHTPLRRMACSKKPNTLVKIPQDLGRNTVWLEIFQCGQPVGS